MSQREVLATIEALLRDETQGLRATVESLATSLTDLAPADPGPYSSEFTFYRGQLPGTRPTNGGGNVMLRPTRWQPNSRYTGMVQREASASIEIGFECFGMSAADNVNEATLVATALAQVLDRIRDYSDAHKATVVDFVPDSPMDFSFGDFEGPTSYGFIARFSIRELSVND
jgi:hypothetical protein